MNYYNEFDEKAAAWLRELIAARLIPAGEVDARSITEVQPKDLNGFTQCHFFAGIGGWSLALQLAGWPSDRPVWTGSCPCQPFSQAGQQKGTADDRHLWPEFCRLIAERHPATVFGEQVASKLGREWLAGIRLNVEGLGYAVGAADLCAACVGAPHIRQRLFWVANMPGARPLPGAHSGIHCGEESAGARHGESERCGSISRLALADSGQCDGLADGQGCQCNGTAPGRQQGDREPQCGCAVGGLADNSSERRNGRPGTTEQARRDELEAMRATNGLEHAESDGREQRRPESSGRCAASGRSSSGMGNTMREGCEGQPLRLLGASNQGAWSNYDLIPCADGKARRVESGTFPLAHGIPGRVGLLRGYGNAINPQVAAEFIKAFTECTYGN